MCAVRFEEFLASHFFLWAKHSIIAGYRYQFQSPNLTKSTNLYRALVSPSNASGTISVKGLSLAFVQCGIARVIPVIQKSDGDVGYTENFISFLRDEVASQQGAFESSVLVIIHNSMLDTLINSAEDLSAEGSAFDIAGIKDSLSKFIDESAKVSTKNLSRILLEYQFEQIADDRSSMFGFESLYQAISDGEIEFDEIRLLNDPAIANMEGNDKQIRGRLDENRKLFEKLTDTLEHYPDQLEDYLPDLGEKFIEKYFKSGNDEDWKIPTFDEYRAEQDRNREKVLEFTSESSASCDIAVRTKGSAKAMQRERHILLVVDEGSDEFDLQLEFIGDRVQVSELALKDKDKELSRDKNLQLRGGGKNTSILITGPVQNEPRFFSLELKRKKTSEKYKFKCLVVNQGQFYTQGIENCFLVDTANKKVPLQMQDTVLEISEAGSGSTIELEKNGQIFRVGEAQSLDFSRLSNELDCITFEVCNGAASLRFEVEGAAPTDSLILPLIFDQTRGARLFSDELIGIFNRSKRRVYIENKELKGEAKALSFLEQEARFVDKRLVYVNDQTKKHISVNDLQTINPNLSAVYSALYDYYDANKTLPSLCGWGPEYQELVGSVVEAYIQLLRDVPEKTYLSDEHKALLNIGFSVSKDQEFITPFHPLVLAYYLYVVGQAQLDNGTSFRDLPKVTLERLSPQGLLPFIYDSQHDYTYVKAEADNAFWLQCVPQEKSNYSYVTKLVKDKASEFVKAFSTLFESAGNGGARPTLIINSINNDQNHELFMGLVSLVIKNHKDLFNIHVNLYDDTLQQTEFDLFSGMANYETIKQCYGLNKGDAKDHSDTIVDLMRTRLTYSKFTHTENPEQAYAHLAFFRNKEKIKVVSVNPTEKLSGIACHGLLSGEASANEQSNYITGFGLNNVAEGALPHIEIAKLVGRMLRPARESTVEYRDNSAIALAVNQQFKAHLKRSYDSSIWTSIIDPKVTLDFFADTEGLLLIHYSDQYTSSASYDAITVTQKRDLYDRVLDQGEGGLVGEFNAFNGEWLLKMITDPITLRKERTGIISAYKLVSCLLAKSDITWVPMSVAEMIRVSGNIGLKMSDSEFSRHLQGYRKGAISDDVLFVGFKDDKLYLLPLEVKTGAGYDASKAVKQAKELLRYLSEELLEGSSIDRKIYRSLFVQEVLMQVDKYKLYSVYPKDYFAEFLARREWWLRGDYELATIANYPKGFVVANLEDDKCLETRVENIDGILKIEAPSSFISKTISTPLGELMNNPQQTAAARIPSDYFLPQITEAESFAQSTEVISQYDEHDKTALNDKSEDETAPEQVERDEPHKKQSTINELNASEGNLKVLVGHEVKHEQPVYWEPTNTAKFMNTNSGIIGTMGTGKTQCTKSVVTQLYRNQHLNLDSKPIGMLIFDYKSDYVDDKFLTVTDGKKYNLHKLPYNPLSLFGDTPMLPVHTARGFSETMGKAFGLGQKQQLRLRKLIGDAYELAGISKSDKTTWSKPAPSIADVWALFIEQEKVEEDSLYAALESLSELEIFEDDVSKCTSLYELIDGIRVIELAGYPPQIQNLVVALTLDLFYSQMQKQGKPEVRGDFRQVTKMILVDEADNFMSQDFPSLRKVLKEGREYGVGVILSTQDITHFKTKENDYSAYILSWVIHRVSQIKNQDIKSLFNKDDKTEQEYLMQSIRGLDKHYSLYVDGDKKISKIKDKAFWELLNE